MFIFSDEKPHQETFKIETLNSISHTPSSALPNAYQSIIKPWHFDKLCLGPDRQFASVMKTSLREQQVIWHNHLEQKGLKKVNLRVSVAAGH